MDSFETRHAPLTEVSSRDVAAAARPALPPRTQQVRNAFEDLVAMGYTLNIGVHPRYRNARAGPLKFDPATVDEAMACVADPGPLDMMEPPRVVHVVAPQPPPSSSGESVYPKRYDLITDEDVLALSFLLGRIPSDRLQFPKQAERVNDIAARGYDLQSDEPGEYGPIGAYAGLRAGHEVRALLGFDTVGKLSDPNFDGVPAVDNHLMPAVRRGIIDDKAIPSFLDRLKGPYADRGGDVVRLAEAIAKGPRPAAERTKDLEIAWDTLVKIDAALNPRAVERMAHLLRYMSATEIGPAARYVISDMNAHCVVPARAEEREKAVWPLVERGTHPANLARLTEAMVRRPSGESLDERLAVHERLALACGHDDVTDDFVTLLALRPSGPAFGSLTDFALPYASMLSQAYVQGERKAAPAVLSSLCELASDRAWPPDEALQGFVSLLLRNRARLDDALHEMAGRATPLPPPQASEFEVSEGHLRINGVDIPVRPRA